MVTLNNADIIDRDSLLKWIDEDKGDMLMKEHYKNHIESMDRIATLDNEQWKSGGDCSKCRRHKYCSKPCKENTRLKDRIIYDAILEKTKMGKALQIMNDIRCGRKEK